MKDPTNLEATMRAAGAEPDPTELLGDRCIVEVVDYRPTPQSAGLSGVFEFRRPTIGDSAEMGVMRARLCRGATWETLDPRTRRVFEALALVETCCVTKPAWFKLDGTDGGVVTDDFLLGLLDEWRAYLADFFRQCAAAGGRKEEGSPVVFRRRNAVGGAKPGA